MPWTYIRKDLFDHAYDLLVHIPGLLADAEGFRDGKVALADLQGKTIALIGKINRWTEDHLYPEAASFRPEVSSWDLSTVITFIDQGIISDYSFARGLAHYFAALLMLAQLGQRSVDALRISPEEAIRCIVVIIQKHALGSPVGCLWPWLVPLKASHFSSFVRAVPEVISLTVQLERRYSWPILQSERYEMKRQT